MECEPVGGFEKRGSSTAEILGLYFLRYETRDQCWGLG